MHCRFGHSPVYIWTSQPYKWYDPSRIQLSDDPTDTWWRMCNSLDMVGSCTIWPPRLSSRSKCIETWTNEVTRQRWTFQMNFDGRIYLYFDSAFTEVDSSLPNWQQVYLGLDISATLVMTKINYSLQWRHNGHDGVSNHRRLDCLRTFCSGADQRKHRSSASLGFEREIHRWPVNSPHKGPVTRKMFPFDDVSCIKSPRKNELYQPMRSFSVWLNTWLYTCRYLSVTRSQLIYEYLQ